MAIRILGIESSCDETAAAVLEDSGTILTSVVASQLAAHVKYGGVVPEIASREHGRAIVPVVREAVSNWDDLSAVAVTQGPGLIGSLLVGATYAKSLSYALDLPLIGINHVEGHIHAVIWEQPVEFPAVALVVSGGHTHLFSVSASYEVRLIARTRDDAAGEAFDKVGKLLGFGYPGGPVIDLLAPHGNADAVHFPIAKLKGNSLDFSFSGLKTAALRWFEATNMTSELIARNELLARTPRPSASEWLAVTPQRTLDAVAAFQRTVVTELLSRIRPSAKEIGAKSIIVSGGVACNRGLRAAAQAMGLSTPIYFPSPALSTDNAVMIAAAAFPKFQRGDFSGLDMPVYSQLRFD